MELRGRRNGWHTMRTNQRIYKAGGGHITVPSRATLHFTDVGTYFGGSYWKVHQLAHFELRRVAPATAASATWSAPARSSTTACATSSAPGPAAARPPYRHYPGCNQNPFQRPGHVLGTSVGWSDIYPAAYHKQWINVAGLRGCFAYRMTVDPKDHLFESNENDNTSPAPRPPALHGRTPAASRGRQRRGRSPGRRARGRRRGGSARSRPRRSRRCRPRSRAGPAARRRRSPGRRRRRIDSGTSSKRAGAGSPLRLAEVWKTGHIAPASGPPIRRTPSRSGSSRQASG